MPNHVKHIATFSGKQEDVDFLLGIIKTEENDDNGEQWTRHIDFNNIIPQPGSLYRGDLGPEDEKRTRGWNWYHWNCENWGTKWNAYSTERSGNEVVFETAWCSPCPVMEKLHEICVEYNVTCEVTYADEDVGCNTGLYKLGGETFQHIQYDDNSPEAWRAYRMTHQYWEEFLVMNEDGTMSFKEE
jgi:hypothetical protein